MANRTSTDELKYRYEALREGLKITDEETLKMLQTTREHDDIGMEIILRNEGEKIALYNFIFDIEESFLSTLEIEEIYQYKELDTKEWDFLSKEQILVLSNTLKLYKSIQREYLLNRADLMVLRKEVDNFVRYHIKGNKKLYKDMINHIINNYSYSDSLRKLGFTSVKEDGVIFIEKMYLNEKTLRYKKYK